jgi:hypothetical protein
LEKKRWWHKLGTLPGSTALPSTLPGSTALRSTLPGSSALRSTQPRVGMSMRNPTGKQWPERKADNLSASLSRPYTSSESLDFSLRYGPPRPVARMAQHFAFLTTRDCTFLGAPRKLATTNIAQCLPPARFPLQLNKRRPRTNLQADMSLSMFLVCVGAQSVSRSDEGYGTVQRFLEVATCASPLLRPRLNCVWPFRGIYDWGISEQTLFIRKGRRELRANGTNVEHRRRLQMKA